MSKLITLNGIQDDSLLNELFDDELLVIEDIQGSKIWVNWNGKEFIIKPKSIQSEQINLIDLAMQNYYNPAIKYLNSLDDRVRGLLNKKWWYCFEYFPDNQPANIEYSRVPKNNLVLTFINKGGGKYEFNAEELDEYSRLFDVDMIPIVFYGKLSDRMIEAIRYFINTSESDLEYVFGEKSFAFFFYKILNPSVKNSFLMDEDDYQKNVEKLIIRSKKKDISFEILNPLYKRMSEKTSTEFVEIYTLILINFLNFCQSINIDEIKLKGQKRDEVYLYLVSKLYNIYVTDIKSDLLQFQFTVPDFFDKQKFKINKELISNKLTKEFIEEDPKLEYIYKVIIGSLNKKKKRAIGLFTDNTVSLFNQFVDSISKSIDLYLNKTQEVELTKAGLLDFEDFFDIQYDKDSEGEVYPDVYSEFGKEEPEENKKKGKGGKMIAGSVKPSPSK